MSIFCKLKIEAILAFKIAAKFSIFRGLVKIFFFKIREKLTHPPHFAILYFFFETIGNMKTTQKRQRKTKFQKKIKIRVGA